MYIWKRNCYKKSPEIYQNQLPAGRSSVTIRLPADNCYISTMDKPSIISNENLVDGTPVKVERIFQDFDVEKEQERDIAVENQERIFQPKFIPFYPNLLSLDLSMIEIVLFGFIDFYTPISESGRFYFTNEQLAKMLKCSIQTISNSVSKLEKLGLIHTRRKIKANGGQIRFIDIVLTNYKSVYKELNSPYIKELLTNNNKIKENKIKGREAPNKITKSSKEDITSDAFKEYLKQTVPFSDVYITSKDLVDLAEKIDSWSKSKGRTVKDWKATARNWLIKDIAKYPKWKPGDIRNTFPNLQKI